MSTEKEPAVTTAGAHRFARGVARPLSAPDVPTEQLRTGLDASTLHRAIIDNLTYVQAVLPPLASRNDWYMAVAHTRARPAAAPLAAHRARPTPSAT